MTADKKPSLDDLLDECRQQATVLRAHGHGTQARSVEEVCDRVSETMRAYLTLLSENEAALRSGWSVRRLQGKFPEWEKMGFAVLDARGKRRYRECIVPPRAEHADDRLAGARGESLRRSGNA